MTQESLLGKVTFDEEHYFQALHAVERFRHYELFWRLENISLN